jgi:predicted amidophosphoribosyltransferase
MYHAYRLISGALNPAFRKDSEGRLLDLKAGNAVAIAAEANEMLTVLREVRLPRGSVLAIVPGHLACDTNAGSPMSRLVECLARQDPRLRSSVDTLVRYRDVEKMATGGDRSVRAQVESMRIRESSLVVGATVVVLDDIVSSGHSMAAARELLMRAGAARVACVAIARTVRVAW